MTERAIGSQTPGGEQMKRVNLMILICCFFFLIPVMLRGVPIIPIGPIEVTGAVSEIEWVPEKKVNGIPGMSGSTGRDRVMPAHFLIKLIDFEKVDSKTAITMTRYLVWSALPDEEENQRPSFILLKIDHKDKSYLEKGMKIRVSGYTVRGDEGGTWTSYNNIDILDRKFSK
jgi:hypothetical protein